VWRGEYVGYISPRQRFSVWWLSTSPPRNEVRISLTRRLEPPASGTSSSDLRRSGGVITPPADVDPKMKVTPPPLWREDASDSAARHARW